MWKAYHSFPLANLRKRGSDGSTICTCCGEYTESFFHAKFGCEAAANVGC